MLAVAPGSLLPLPAAVAVVAILAAWVLAYYALFERGEAVGRRIACSMVRLLGLAGISILVMAPSATVKTPGSRRPAAAMLIDGSMSLQIPDGPGGAARSAEAASALKALREGMSRIEPSVAAEWYSFAGDLSPLDDGPLPAEGAATAPGSALEAAAAVPRDGRLRAVVMVTDGASNSGTGPAAAARCLAAAGIQVHTVRLGGAVKVADCAVESLEVPPRVRVRDAVPVKCGIRASGCQGRQLTVALEVDGEEIETRRFDVDSDRLRRVVEFSHVLRAAGSHRLAVTVRAADDDVGGAAPDAVPGNDSRVTYTTAWGGALKVMLVAGKLTWDYGALRSALASSREIQIETVPAFLKGSGALGAAAARWEEFHVVVLSGITGDELAAGEWRRLAGLVRGGMGVMVIAGERGGGVARGPLGEILPVAMDRTAEPVPCEGKAILTAEGVRHGAMAVTENVNSRRSAWRSMAALPLRMPAKPGRAGAAVLLADEAGGPLVVAGEVQRGRSLVILSPDSHGWRREGDTSGPTYEAFVRSAVRHLAGLDAGGDKKAMLRLEAHSVLPGERLGMGAVMLGEGGGELTVKATPVAGPAWVPKVKLSPSGGTWWGEIRLSEPGEYTLELLVDGETADRSGVVVESSAPELSRIEPDHGMLEEMASTGGGLCVESSEAGAVVARIEEMAAGARSEGIRHRPLWDSGILLGLIVIFLSLEWWLHRR